MSTRTAGFEPNHMHLILRQHKGSIGIWHLREDTWHTKPFTTSTVEGATRLKAVREGRGPAKAGIFSWETIALVVFWAGFWMVVA